MKDRAFLVGLLLHDKDCLVIGGDEEAMTRADNLLEAGARVRIVAREAIAPVRQLCRRAGLRLDERDFEPEDLDAVWLCVLTERDAQLAERVGRETAARRIFFCAVDQPAHNTFSHTGIVRSGPVSVGISTDGRAPALARKLKAELKRLFSEARLGGFAKSLSDLRAATPPAERKAVLTQAVAGVRFNGALLLPDIDHSNLGKGSSGSETG